MKRKLIGSALRMLIFCFFVWMSVNNLHKDPSNNITIFSIVLFSAMAGMNVGILITEYATKKKGEANRKF